MSQQVEWGRRIHTTIRNAARIGIEGAHFNSSRTMPQRVRRRVLILSFQVITFSTARSGSERRWASLQLPKAWCKVAGSKSETSSNYYNLLTSNAKLVVILTAKKGHFGQKIWKVKWRLHLKGGYKFFWLFIICRSKWPCCWLSNSSFFCVGHCIVLKH